MGFIFYRKTIDKIIYPSYAVLLKGWQLYVLRDSFLKKVVQRLYRPMIGRTNYMQQMLMGMKNIPRDVVEMYQAMEGGRWSGWLNNRNDRNMRVRFPRPNFNNIDSDMVRKLYNETQL